MNVWHVTMANHDRMPLFTGDAARRRALHAIARVAWQSLALFCLVDTHVHLVAIGDRVRAGRLAQSLGVALGRLVAARLASARIRPVESRNHMERLLDYVLRQPRHHGLGVQPALWPGSAFLDLVGARVLARTDLRVLDVLPRYRMEMALCAVGLAGAAIRPIADEAVRAAGAFALARAAASATAADVSLTGNTPPAVAARVAVCHIGRAAGIPLSEVCAALKVVPRCVRFLLARPADQRVVRATRVRLSVEAAVAARPMPLAQLSALRA